MATIFDNSGSKKAPNYTSAEFLVFWTSLIPILVVVVFAVIYMPTPLLAAFIAVLAFMSGVGIFFSSRQLSRAKFKVEIERDELKGIVMNLEDGVILYDKDFKVLFFNPAAEKIFSLRAESLLDHRIRPQDAEREDLQRFIQVIYPSLAPTVVSRSKEGVYPQVVDVSFEDPQLDLRVITAPMGDDYGRILGFLKIVHDRTREEYLLRSKNEFVTVASHQLRGPITNVTWALEVLDKDDTLSEGSKILVQNAFAAGKQLLRIIEDLINIAKIEEGKFGYKFEQVNLIEFLNDVLTEVLPQAKRAGIKIYFDRPENELPKVYINRDKMLMVVYNFLDNAIRYNVENGEVRVKIELVKNEPFIEVSVKDTGIGVPAGEINRLFSKFYRADNAVKFQTEGSGLGLYINKNIILAHGGKLWAESELNRGTTFHFTLPTSADVIPDREVQVTG